MRLPEKARDTRPTQHTQHNTVTDNEGRIVTEGDNRVSTTMSLHQKATHRGPRTQYYYIDNIHIYIIHTDTIGREGHTHKTIGWLNEYHTMTHNTEAGPHNISLIISFHKLLPLILILHGYFIWLAGIEVKAEATLQDLWYITALPLMLIAPSKILLSLSLSLHFDHFLSSLFISLLFSSSSLSSLTYWYYYYWYYTYTFHIIIYYTW